MRIIFLELDLEVRPTCARRQKIAHEFALEALSLVTGAVIRIISHQKSRAMFSFPQLNGFLQSYDDGAAAAAAGVGVNKLGLISSSSSKDTGPKKSELKSSSKVLKP